jgi:hypothetical protein
MLKNDGDGEVGRIWPSDVVAENEGEIVPKANWKWKKESKVYEHKQWCWQQGKEMGL